MSLFLGVMTIWLALAVMLIALVIAGARADRRTARQLAGVGSNGELGPGTLRTALAIEPADLALEGYGGLLLNRLAVQTSRLIGVEATAIFVHDPIRDDLALVAGHRLDPESMGARVKLGGHIRDAVLKCTRTSVPKDELWTIQHVMPHKDALIVGLEGGNMRGALVAAGSGPFSERDLALVGHVAELAGAGLMDVELRAGLDAALEGGVRALEAAIENADLRAADTSRELVRLSTTLGRQLGLDSPALVELQIAARLRECGELSEHHELEDDVPPLVPSEMSARASDMLARVPGLEVVALLVRHEHERWDGRGSPDALYGERIPLASRILAVAATFAQLTGPGRSSDADALTVISAASGTRYDPVVVATLAGLALPAGAASEPVEHGDWAAADRELALA